MKTVTIRDLRLRWPATEKSLHLEGELTITRDGVPVAKLVNFVLPKKRRKRWNPDEHQRWMKDLWGGKVFASADESIAQTRADYWEKTGK